MPWFNADDGLSSHPKVTRLKRGVTRERAMGLWVLAGTWSAKYLTEGQIPAEQVEELGCTAQAARWLVESNLWHGPGHGCPECPQPPAGGFVFHDWPQANPTRAAVLSKREARAAAGAKGGRASGAVRGRTKREATTEANASQFVEPQGLGQGHSKPLLTLISRLAAGDAHGFAPPPAEVIEAWQAVAGPGVDLNAEAMAYFARFGDRPPRDERGAWLGWLSAAAGAAARRHAAAQIDPDADIRPPAGCGNPDCSGGFLGYDAQERPIRCPVCKPNLRLAGSEAS